MNHPNNVIESGHKRYKTNYQMLAEYRQARRTADQRPSLFKALFSLYEELTRPVSASPPLGPNEHLQTSVDL